MREIGEILLSLEALGVTPATDRKCAKAEHKLKQLNQDFARKKKFLAELTEKNDVHQRAIMEMLVRDLGDLGFDQRNDHEIAEGIEQIPLNFLHNQQMYIFRATLYSIRIYSTYIDFVYFT